MFNRGKDKKIRYWLRQCLWRIIFFYPARNCTCYSYHGERPSFSFFIFMVNNLIGLKVCKENDRSSLHLHSRRYIYYQWTWHTHYTMKYCIASGVQNHHKKYIVVIHPLSMIPIYLNVYDHCCTTYSSKGINLNS